MCSSDLIVQGNVIHIHVKNMNRNMSNGLDRIVILIVFFQYFNVAI